MEAPTTTTGRNTGFGTGRGRGYNDKKAFQVSKTWKALINTKRINPKNAEAFPSLSYHSTITPILGSNLP